MSYGPDADASLTHYLIHAGLDPLEIDVTEPLNSFEGHISWLGMPRSRGRFLIPLKVPSFYNWRVLCDMTSGAFFSVSTVSTEITLV